MTAAHLILVWEQRDDPNLLRHAQRAQGGRAQPAHRRLRDVRSGRAPRTTRGSPPAVPCTACAPGSIGRVAIQTETLQVSGIRCERCVMRLGHVLKGHEGLESANANLSGEVDARVGRRAHEPRRAPRRDGARRLPRARCRRNSRPPGIGVCRASLERPLLGWPRMSESAPTAAETRSHRGGARDRVRFEEEALELTDQVYRVARRLVGSREEAEDLVQDTYARAFRAWQHVPAGHEPARLAAPDPHEPQHRPRPQAAAHARHAAARGRRLLPLQQARVGGRRDENPRRGARDRAALAGRRRRARSPRCRTTSAT